MFETNLGRVESKQVYSILAGQEEDDETAMETLAKQGVTYSLP